MTVAVFDSVNLNLVSTIATNASFFFPPLIRDECCRWCHGIRQLVVQRWGCQPRSWGLVVVDRSSGDDLGKAVSGDTAVHTRLNSAGTA